MKSLFLVLFSKEYFLFRLLYYASIGQQNRGDWGHCDGCTIWFWSCKFAVQLFVSLHQVPVTSSLWYNHLGWIEFPVSLFFFLSFPIILSNWRSLLLPLWMGAFSSLLFWKFHTLTCCFLSSPPPTCSSIIITIK